MPTTPTQKTGAANKSPKKPPAKPIVASKGSVAKVIKPIPRPTPGLISGGAKKPAVTEKNMSNDKPKSKPKKAFAKPDKPANLKISPRSFLNR